MSSDKTNPPNVYAYRGRYLLSAYNHRHKDVLPDIYPCEYRLDGRYNDPKPSVPTDPPKHPICIIGAGVAGLYTAMILETLGFKYQIIEGSGRVGGRLFTYHFPDEENEKNPYDYFDVGAMRFPRTPFMARTFNLIEVKLKGLKLIPFVFGDTRTNTTRHFFNNVHSDSGNFAESDDPFKVGTHITDKRLKTPEGVQEVIDEVLQPFRDLFVPKQGKELDIEHSMEILFKRTNQFSMRGYMQLLHQMSPNEVHWCETLGGSTGLFDRALTEVVAESLAFDWPKTEKEKADEERTGIEKEHQWYCIDGGSDLLPKAMLNSLEDVKNNNETIRYNSPVTAISHEVREGNEGKLKAGVVKVSINGKEHPQEYSAVISTVPLPRLSLMDLTKAGIHTNYTQWSAIRSLQYGPAIKIGIRFKEAWWEGGPYFIHGGQTKTDLPLRTVVYPSYPDPSKGLPPSRVLIVSYCWTQDADRLGSLIPRDGTFPEELFDLVFRNLAAVHCMEVDEIKKYFEEEKKEKNFFVWDWARDPLTMGAFGVFGPGVYDEHGIYNELLKPAAGGRLFFAGEAASVCHGWVAGALDSAWRAVDQCLALHYQDPTTPRNAHNPVRVKFWELWGGSEYWDEAEDDDLVHKNHNLAMESLIITREKAKRNNTGEEEVDTHSHD